MDFEKIQKAVRDIIIAIGEDPDRPGLQGTPERVARMYGDIFGGGRAPHRKYLHTCGLPSPGFPVDPACRDPRQWL